MTLQSNLEEGGNPTFLLSELLANSRWYPPSLEDVQYLVSQGADVNATFDDKYKRTCICIAVHYGFMDIIYYLLHHGVDIHVHTYHKNNILHICVLFDRIDLFRYIVSIKDTHLLLNAGNYMGHTPLTLSIALGRVEFVQLILTHLEVDGVDFTIARQYAYILQDTCKQGDIVALLDTFEEHTCK